MITAFQLIFSPFETWERITLAQRGILSILCLHLVPLLVVGLGIEGYLLTRLGEARGELGYMIKVSNESALRYVIAYAVLILVGIVVGSKFLSLASQSFN